MTEDAPGLLQATGVVVVHDRRSGEVSEHVQMGAPLEAGSIGDALQHPLQGVAA